MNKNITKNIIIGVLALLLGLSLCYIGYDKLINKDKINEQENNTSDVDYRFTSMSIQDYKDLSKEINQETDRKDDGTIEFDGMPFEYQLGVILIRQTLMKKLNYLPSSILIDGGKATDLTDEAKASYLLWYIYDNKLAGNKISKKEVDDIFKYNFNITDYKIKSGTAVNVGSHITETDDAYEISLDGPDSSNKSIVNRIEYDKETKELKAYFESYMIGGSGAATGMKTSEGTAVFKIYYENKEYYNDFYFALDRIISNK